MAVTRIWDADNGVWQLVGGTVGAEASGAGLYVPISGETMTGPLLLATNPTIPEQAATKAYVDSVAGGGGGTIPTGVIEMFAGTTPPTGFLFCDGSVISRATYATLFGVIGTAYGAGDGSTTFGLPDLRQRFPLGKAASGSWSTLGQSGGAMNHTHTGGSHSHSTPAHSHAQVAHVHNLGNSPSSGGGYSTSSIGGHDHTVPSQSTSSDSHSHSFSDSFSTGGGSLSGSTQADPSGVQRSTDSHTHSGSISGSTSSDSHSHTRAAINTDAVGNHSHTTVAHVHDLGNSPSGGATTTGNASPTTNAGGAVETDAANPAYQIVHFIIKT
jgi:microcystin-dependent protein